MIDFLIANIFVTFDRRVFQWTPCIPMCPLALFFINLPKADIIKGALEKKGEQLNDLIITRFALSLDNSKLLTVS